MADYLQMRRQRKHILENTDNAVYMGGQRSRAGSIMSNSLLCSVLDDAGSSDTNTMKDTVQVHRDSAEPAKLDAEAFAQGNQVYLGPGQERHLEHELGHVIQQRKSSVRPTDSVRGKRVNTDAMLERQADRYGSDIEGLRMSVDSGGGTPNAYEPIQMAGHSGVMIFGNGVLLKRIERNEYNEYRRVRQEQQADPHSLSNGAFPNVLSVFDKKPRLPGHGSDEEQEVAGGGYNERKFTEWANKHEEGDCYVEMQNLKDAQSSIWDFKVGQRTAVKEELESNHGYSTGDALAKEKRMNEVDEGTETAVFGLRDSDRTKTAKSWLARTFCCGDSTLEGARDTLNGNAYGENDPVIKDVNAIEQYIQNSNTVYIASSIIVSYHHDRSQKDRDHAKLIDLAHPVKVDPEGFNQDEFDHLKAGMLLGIRNVRHLLLGQDLET